MKIAIYHNLKKGGALNSIIFPLKHLKQNNKIDIYCFTKNIPQNLVDNFFIYKIKETKNIFQSLFQILFELKKINKKISKEIDSKQYDLILVFPCLLVQSPYILRFLKHKEKVVYFFTETKREFYEKTSFDYWSPKKIITRLIRIPIKYIDKKNCKSIKYIISNSKFTANNLQKIYNKKSTVIYPGLKPIKPKKITISNNKKVLSVGLISKIKGHDFSIKQVTGILNKLTILGRETEESEKIYKIAIKNKVLLKKIKTENNKIKDSIYNDYSIYLANNFKEPFGITTLEAASRKCIVLGKREGGTPEIIKDGVNGFLYSNIKEARNTLKKILKQNKIVLTQINTINWEYTSNEILKFYNKNIKEQ